MAKSPRKSGGSRPKPSKKPHSNEKRALGSKNFNPYASKEFNNGSFHSTKGRRFSIVDSTSSTSSSGSESESEAPKTYPTRVENSDSESSLTAVSDDDVNRLAKNSSMKRTSKSTKRGMQRAGKTAAKYSRKSTGSYGRKRTPKKTVNWSKNDLEEDDDDDDDEEEDNHIGDIYSMIDHTKTSKHDRSDNESNDESGEDSDSDGTSSDDSDVDFLKLQAERKARSIKAAKAQKGLRQTKSESKYESSSDNESALESDAEVDISDLVALTKGSQGGKSVVRTKPPKTSGNKIRNNSVSKARYGRRKSEALLPEDINFKFEFDDFSKLENSVIDSDEKEDVSQLTKTNSPQDEDIGEEIFDLPAPAQTEESNMNFDGEFDSQLIQVPRFKEDELNSDEDYEIDDNELLATLQADNGMDEFLPMGGEMDVHRNSIGSIDEDENDQFLKEEEKFLVNEFENNGFDDEGIDIEDYDLSESSNRNSMLDSFNNMNNHESVIQYESSSENGFESDDEDLEDDDEGYEDLIDFNESLFEEENKKSQQKLAEKKSAPQSHSKKSEKAKSKHRRPTGLNSDEDDDSYLWNYFFSSDNGSESSDGENFVTDNEVDQLFEEPKLSSGRRMTLTNIGKRKNTTNLGASVVSGNDSYHEEDYDSGESTDVNESLPKSSDKTKLGSKMAKEVLSSKTADYRPPVLGTWVAIDSKPFGIIDGLSTSTLTNKNAEPRFKKKIAPGHGLLGAHANIPGSTGTDDSALGLDELLNISELDNDNENDVRIWRDFNNRKNQVPLGAFRNKSVLQNTMIHPENITSHYNHTTKSNNEFNKRRYSLTSHHTGISGSSSSSSNSNGKRNSVSKSGAISKKSNRRNSATSSYGSGTTKIEPLGSSMASSKLKRRSASIVEAVSEGFRPTKSGLFSEHALADVEEVLGDDNDIMDLIKGL